MEIIKIGCNSVHDENFKISRPKGYPFYLFLLVKTPALFIIDGVQTNVESNSIILYDVNYPHYYSAVQKNYINDWVQFKVDDGKNYFGKLNIPMNKILKVYNDMFICDMLKNISSEFYSVNSNKYKTMDLLLQAVFIKLSEIISTSAPKQHMNAHYNKLVGLREKIYSNPQIQWTVDMMAGKLNLCSPYFQKIYREIFGVSCISDVISCRINYAKDILLKTDKSITCIAEECGYKNEVHFMRQFKKYTGFTPTEYRKNVF